METKTEELMEVAEQVINLYNKFNEVFYKSSQDEKMRKEFLKIAISAGLADMYYRGKKDALNPNLK